METAKGLVCYQLNSNRVQLDIGIDQVYKKQYGSFIFYIFK